MLRLYLKHRIATSPFAGFAASIRSKTEFRHLVRNPELGMLRREGDYQREIFRQLIKPDSACVDVGAHIGSVAYQMARIATEGTLTIVEAQPDKAEWLRARFPAAEVHNVAVADEVGEVTFFEDLDRPGFSSLHPGKGRTREYRVSQTTLDTLLKGQRVDFLKLDVEGYEPQVLAGASEVLQQQRPAIMFEAGAISEQSVDYPKMLDQIMAAGYNVYALVDYVHGRSPLSQERFTLYRTFPFVAFNYLAVPGESHTSTHG